MVPMSTVVEDAVSAVIGAVALEVVEISMTLVAVGIVAEDVAAVVANISQ